MLPDIVKRVREERHEVCNHTFHHPSLHHISHNKALSEWIRAGQHRLSNGYRNPSFPSTE
ncbi:polysaccharide deacetylase family protein [Paenibacillus sp. TY11]|uniref:polysaccharide deacetylase family protein n=1 Tax=Paenibacillus sp. TY11 TaxID=3448633 RepID=UPI0040391E99